MRNRTKPWLQIGLWAVTIGWLALLVWLSSQDGTGTAQTSLRVARLFMGLFHISPGKLAMVNGALRTLAHFGCFFVLGGMAYAAAYATWPNRRPLAAWVMAPCGVVAVLDEGKKIFIAGRHLSWPEAGLNMLGVVCGVLLASGVRCLAARMKARRGG